MSTSGAVVGAGVSTILVGQLVAAVLKSFISQQLSAFSLFI
jgi:hypothetical protein